MDGKSHDSGHGHGQGLGHIKGCGQGLEGRITRFWMLGGLCNRGVLECPLCFLGRDDFQFFWNFITALQILPCVIETRRYGYIRDSGGRVETPH